MQERDGDTESKSSGIIIHSSYHIFNRGNAIFMCRAQNAMSKKSQSNTIVSSNGMSSSFRVRDHLRVEIVGDLSDKKNRQGNDLLGIQRRERS